MHLQALELIGFKSFADKTTFTFHEGVTAIVGPNGCGKSNVLDAVRWVLGEQSAKALRGGEMADVIFSGTETRKPLGFAEVSLTFTECSAELGVDWHDVRVTRRVYRDGISEYLLNKNVVRLKDIQALFADTGVGRSAYSIMEQGKIDLILSSRPEDRRAVFEEAAGITKYKTQKREALRKLEATEANLLRIGDVIKEVKRQIGSLQRQAGKARRYQALLADLRVLDTHYSRREYEKLAAELEQSRVEASTLTGREEEALEKIRAGEEEVAAHRAELESVDARIGDTRNERQRLENELNSNRSRIDFNRQRTDELREQIARAESEIADAEGKRTAQLEKISELNVVLEQLAATLATDEGETERFSGDLATAQEERQSAERQLQETQLTISRLEARVESLGGEMKNSSSRRDTTAERVAELHHSMDEARRSLEEKRGQLAAGRAAILTEQQTLESLVAQLQTAEAESHQHQRGATEAEQEMFVIERVMAEKQSRLDVLQQLNEQGEGLVAGSQALLQGSIDSDAVRSALAGALVSNLEVDRDTIVAIEAALGRAQHAVVVDNPGIAAEIIRALNERKLGQAALALPQLPSEAAPSSNDLPAEARAWALDRVTAPERLRPLVHALLRGVALVDDLATALRLKARHPELQFATMAGEFVSQAGIVFGGSGAAQADTLLSRQAAIDTLRGEISELEAKRQSSTAARDEARNAAAAAVAFLDQVRLRQQSAHATHSTSERQILLYERDFAEAESRLHAIENERATLQSQIEVADGRIAHLGEELAQAQTQLEDQKNRRAELQTTLAHATECERGATDSLNQLRLRLAAERQRHDSLLQQVEPMNARAAELAERIHTRRDDIEQAERRIAAQAAESREAELAIERFQSEIASVEERLGQLISERSAKMEAAAALETDLRKLRDELNELRHRRGKHEVRQTQLQLKLDNIAEHITRRYQVDLREFAPDHYSFQKTLRAQISRREKTEGGAAATPQTETEAGAPPDTVAVAPDLAEADLEKIIADLTRQLDNMGPVNLDAVQEYDELEERHRFLENQNNDLVKSRAELLDVIARINSTTQKLFAETFAQVRINFREMFAELFGGGRADLQLLDENDLLECGIDIIAKPPGKQLQSVSLLSGGERTLTAVALLFAIYMVRPSPFCVLDEMDAPLDESNINRFIRVLERFEDHSQFIIITHNKRTIAKADVLYGVTMEERGVSRLVGMKMTPAPKSDTAAKTNDKAGAQRNLVLEDEPALAATR